MEIYEQIFENSPSLMLLFSEEIPLVQKILHDLLQRISKSYQVIIVDVKRIWQADRLTKRSHIIYVDDKINLIDKISQLESLITPRLKLIIIDGLSLYFRDYQGRGAKSHGINTRQYASCLSMLKNLSQKGIYILVTSYQHSFNRGYPIMFEAAQYYCSKMLRVSKNQNEKIYSENILL
ncbi:MAG: hypothetical protein ACXAD7_16345 [Candidatus Kariarchaeaceae archaeon]|jgi:hypothetical protein